MNAARRIRPAGLEFRADGAALIKPPALIKGAREHRFQPGLQDFKLNPETREFEGYGCVYGVKDSYKCVWEPGVFAATLADWRSKQDLPSFYLQHDWDNLIGQWLDMREDNKGLWVKGRFINSVFGDHAKALVAEDIAKGLSIGFVAIDERIENENDWETYTRYITKADLYEISLVERAAVPGSAIDETSLRSAIRPDMSRREVEKFLIGAGMARDAAKTLAGQWKPKDAQARDAASPEGDEARDAPAKVNAEAARALLNTVKAAQSRSVNRELMSALDNAISSLKR